VAWRLEFRPETITEEEVREQVEVMEKFQVSEEGGVGGGRCGGGGGGGGGSSTSSTSSST